MEQTPNQTHREPGPLGYQSRETQDRPLNLEEDQAAYIRRRMRRLNLEKGLANTRRYATPVLLASAVLSLLARRYKLGTMIAGGLLMSQAVKLWKPDLKILHTRDPEEIDLDLYAMKLERGDYGKLEVIPFR